MERADVTEVLLTELSAQQIIESRILLISEQLDGLERLIETGRSTMKCPTCWNTAAGLIDQLRFHIPAIWYTAEETLNNIEKRECEPVKEFGC